MGRQMPVSDRPSSIHYLEKESVAPDATLLLGQNAFDDKADNETSGHDLPVADRNEYEETRAAVGAYYDYVGITKKGTLLRRSRMGLCADPSVDECTAKCGSVEEAAMYL